MARLILQAQMPIDKGNAVSILSTSPFVSQFTVMLMRRGIVLSADQLTDAQIAFVRLRERQVVLDLKVAKIEFPSATQCVLSIPPHFESNDELFGAFEDDISEILSQEQAARVISAVGDDMWKKDVLACKNLEQITLETTGQFVPTGAVEIVQAIKSPADGKVWVSTTSILRPSEVAGNAEYSYLVPYIPR
jgi:hypothetical protein